MGYADRPPAPPLNLVGDFGGGAMYLLCGILAALLERGNSSRGQVIDAAMTDGTASLLSPFYGLLAMGLWTTGRHSNRLDGGAHFYGCYECADGKYVSVGSLEPQFYACCWKKPAWTTRNSARNTRGRIGRNCAKSSRRYSARGLVSNGAKLMEGSDVCFAPVLDLAEALEHPHNRARKTFVDFEGVPQPAPAPRFSRSQGEIQSPPAFAGEHSEQVLADWGFSGERIEQLKMAGEI